MDKTIPFLLVKVDDENGIFELKKKIDNEKWTEFDFNDSYGFNLSSESNFNVYHFTKCYSVEENKI